MKRKKAVVPQDLKPDQKKAKTDENLSTTGPKVDESVRNQWRPIVYGTKSRPKGVDCQGVVDPEAEFYQNGKPRNFMVRGDGAYKVGEHGKVLKPTDRYKGVGIGGREYKLHTLVCTAFHGPAPSIKHEVNHILKRNKDKSDPQDVNAAWNVEWMTRSENVQDSHDTNPYRKQSGEQESRKLDGVYGKKVEEKLVVHYFKNVDEACELHNLDATEVDKCAKGEQEQTGGWEFYYPPETAPEDKNMQWEEWLDLIEEPESTMLGSVKKLPTRKGFKTPMVSNLGRYQSCRGRKSFGFENDEGYCKVSVGGDTYSLHTLIMYAFNKHSWNKSYTSVDHTNRIRNDNTLGNLQWSDAKMQQRNVDQAARGAKNSKGQGHAVEARNPSIGKNEWQKFDSATMAQADTGVRQPTISEKMKKLKLGEVYAHKTRAGEPTGWQFRRPIAEPI